MSAQAFAILRQNHPNVITADGEALLEQISGLLQ